MVKIDDEVRASRVITTRRNSTYTLKVIGEDGNTQIRIAIDGPLPEGLRSLMERGNAGDMRAAEEYVTQFIHYWHNTGADDWMKTAATSAKH